MQGTQIDNFLIENLSTTKNFSMPTLIEEMNTVILVKDQFQYREKIKLGRFLRKFLIIRTLMKKRNTIIFSVGNSSKLAVFSIEILLGEIGTVVAGNYNIENRAKSN